ncbi:MAG: ABC transporter ATP-binding protein [Bacteroidetes bacterium]|nr:ABC transporter ATP-binding protein [Bacteroidota bacterium]
MSLPVIKIESLSKKFVISHEAPERYTSLRDEIAKRAKKFARSNNKEQRRALREEFFALNDITFDVKQGDRVGIIGRNGAGKSTLLKILSRITEPTSGRITIRGRVASLLEVGTGFHPELTGRENIFLNGAILGMSRVEIRRKFDEIVNFAEIEKFLDTPVKRYSSGMYVRLAFAVAAHLEPEILVVDEVLAVGDAQFQKKCLGKMEEASKNDGRTVLFVSHNMDAISNLCNNGIVLEKGRVAFCGDMSEGIKLYLNNSNLSKLDAWTNPEPKLIPYIANASIELTGDQPELVLTVDLSIQAEGIHKPAFIAFDIQNSMGVTIMQAIPQIQPFIEFEKKVKRFRTEIFLNGLIPDNYSLSIWIGPHNTETYDFQKNILGFEVVHSPNKGRTFPHHHGHGYSVPVSSIAEI